MSLLSRIVTVISGLILPRLILLYFGSEINGLVSSIRQFLGIITFLDLGVGSVVLSALYHPLARKDNRQVSNILSAARSYFRKIAIALIVYVVILIIFYPLFIDSNYGYVSTGFLIFSLSISQLSQYYFGMSNQLLLNANQQSYIKLTLDIIVTILNLLVSVFLITQGATIEVVKLGSGLVYLIRPLYLYYYVRKNFNIDYDIEVKKDPLPQKWSGMGQHIAGAIQDSTDVVILTLFSTLENVSVYAIYNMVVTAIKLLFSSLTTGIQSFFGNLFVNDEIVLLNKFFDKIEWIVHTGVIYLYGMTAVLINSFVMIYTTGIEDVSYNAPMFSFLLVIASAAYSLRTPYQSMVFSAGHFKQTQMSSYIEAGLNIIISIALVNQFGLIGIAIGTLVSMIYRTTYLVSYLSRNIVFRPIKKFVRHVFIDFISLGAIMGTGVVAENMYQIETIIDWTISSIILGIINLILLFIINFMFYRETMISTIRGIFRRSQ